MIRKINGGQTAAIILLSEVVDCLCFLSEVVVIAVHKVVVTPVSPLCRFIADFHVFASVVADVLLDL